MRVCSANCAQGCRRCEHGFHPVLLHHPPEGAGVRRAHRLALVQHTRAAVQERGEHDVRMADDPSCGWDEGAGEGAVKGEGEYEGEGEGEGEDKDKGDGMGVLVMMSMMVVSVPMSEADHHVSEGLRFIKRLIVHSRGTA